MKILLQSICLFLISTGLWAQVNPTDVINVRKHMERLSADKYKGRGYVKGGMDDAARYISRAYRKMGLKSFGVDYFQNFKMPIVQFGGDMSVLINKKPLQPGTDFLVDPFSKGANFENKQAMHLDLLEVSKCWTEANKQANWLQLKDRLAKNSQVWVLHQTDTFKAIMGWKGIRALAQHLPEGDYIVPLKSKPLWFPAQEYKPARIIYLYGEVSKNANWIQDVGVRIASNLDEAYGVRNVIGYVPAVSPTDKYIVFTAHYDHIGMMGKKTIFNGANDNASGTAMMLNLAEYYAKNPQAYNIVFIACAAEEAGLLGAKHFVDNPYFPLENIKFLVNLDIWGDASRGVAVVNGKTFEKEYNYLVAANKDISGDEKGFFKEIRKGDPANNSDHAPFFAKGVPCFFLFGMGGPGHYHDTNDKAETLSLTNINEASYLIKLFIQRLVEQS